MIPSISPRTIALVGVNRESARLLTSLSGKAEVQIVTVLNPSTQSLDTLRQFPRLDIVVNTTGDERITRQIKAIRNGSAEVVSALTARLLFCEGTDELITGNIEGYRRKILDSMHEIQETMLLGQDRDRLLKLLLQIAINTCQGDSGSIMMKDVRKRSLSIEVADGLAGDVVSNTRQKLTTGVAGKVIQLKKPLLLTGTAEKAIKQPVEQRTDLIASICTPLMRDNEVIGVLNINSKDPAHVFDNHDLMFCMTFADYISRILQSAEHYAASQKNLPLLSLLDGIRRILDMDTPFEERLNLALMKLSNTLDTDICKFYEYDKMSDIFVLRASGVLDMPLIQGKRIKLNEASKELVLNANGSVCIDSAGGTQRYIAQPLRRNGSVGGILLLRFHSGNRSRQQECTVLENVADLLAREMQKTVQTGDYRLHSIKASALSEIAFRLTDAASMPELMKLIVSNACFILETEACILRMAHHIEQYPPITQTFSLTKPHRMPSFERFDAYLVERIIETKKCVFIQDTRTAPSFVSDPAVHSVLGMPIFFQNRIAGALSIYNKRLLSPGDSKHFTPTDKELFHSFCLQASQALYRFL
jgi:GAF domain-containing protein